METYMGRSEQKRVETGRYGSNGSNLHILGKVIYRQQAQNSPLDCILTLSEVAYKCCSSPILLSSRLRFN